MLTAGSKWVTKAVLVAVGVVAHAGGGNIPYWYNGDFDGRHGLRSQREPSYFDAYTYDDFVVGSPGVLVSAAWGNFLTKADSQRAYFEIRRDMREGFGGTLLASAEFDVTRSRTGRSGLGFAEQRFHGAITPLRLEPGRYWLTVALVTRQDAYLATTSGQDEGPSQDPNPPPLGEPRGNNDNSFIYDFPRGFRDTSYWLGAGTWDFSLGVEIVPEARSALILCALSSLLVLTRRPRACARYRVPPDCSPLGDERGRSRGGAESVRTSSERLSARPVGSQRPRRAADVRYV